MANYMAEVAKLLGVEFGEEFECEGSSCIYKITENGLLCNGCYGADSLMMILNGERIITYRPWKPSMYNTYYYTDGYHVYNEEWMGYLYNYDCYKLGNCYKTQKEAEANRDKWSRFYASDEVLEV